MQSPNFEFRVFLFFSVSIESFEAALPDNKSPKQYSQLTIDYDSLYAAVSLQFQVAVDYIQAKTDQMLQLCAKLDLNVTKNF